MIKYYCLLLLAFTSWQIGAQQFCGTDELHQQLYQAHPGIASKVFQNHLQLESFTQAYVNTHKNQRQTVIYTIPIVFHVIHLGGSENISDAQIEDQVRILNEDYQKRNADTANTINDFKSIAADCQIEFKLAKIDPDGNCTKGITRHFDGRTIAGDHAVKDIVHWDPSKYLNVYVCMGAAGLAGHALVPSAADTIPEWDGIVIAHTYVGDIGTGDPSRSVVLTHEIGHYLNLQHTWGGNNVPGYPYLPVNDAGNCSYDDGVNDTPNTIGWSSCVLSHSSCGTLDNVQNFMEYAYCPTMFTEGQKLRMHAALNSTIANRSNLWSASNLIATGVNSPIFCSTDFTQNQTLFCEGSNVQFEDLSYNQVSQWQWYFEGGTPTTSTSQNPLITYSTPGTYDVKLISGDGVTSDSLLLTDLIRVLPAPGIANSIVEGFEGSSLGTTQLIPVDLTGNAQWNIIATAGSNSSQSLFLNNLDGAYGENNTLVSEVLDLSNINDLDLTFDYAFAKPVSNTVADYLRVSVSDDCGATWTVRKQLAGSQLLTKSDSIATPFVPTSGEWKNVAITSITNGFWTNEFRLKFEFVKDNGNHFYLDNINLFDPAMAGVNLLDKKDFQIYPNPSHGVISVLYDGVLENIPYLIVNQLGAIVQKGTIQNEQINIQSLSKGVYFLQLPDQPHLPIVKLIKS